MTEGIFILLGSNLGNRIDNLAAAAKAISQQIGDITHRSSVYETAAWGKTDQSSFYNQVLQITTTHTPVEILEMTQRIETELGRVRKEKWGERTIDIDLLYYNAELLDISTLKVPHPGIPNRRFTLIPLVELAPDFIHPQLNKSNQTLLEECPDILEVVRL